MKFNLTKTSRRYDDPITEIEIDSMDDLISFIKNHKCEVIIGAETYDKEKSPNEFTIEIYDDYRE